MCLRRKSSQGDYQPIHAYKSARFCLLGEAENSSIASDYRHNSPASSQQVCQCWDEHKHLNAPSTHWELGLQLDHVNVLSLFSDRVFGLLATLSLPHYSGIAFIIHRPAVETQKAEAFIFYILSQRGILPKCSRTVSPGWAWEQEKTVIFLWIDFSASPRGINLSGRQIRHTDHTYTRQYICFWGACLKGSSCKLGSRVLRRSSDV